MFSHEYIYMNILNRFVKFNLIFMTDRSSVDSLQYRYVTVSDVKGLGRRTAPPGSRISRDPSMLQSKIMSHSRLSRYILLASSVS